MTSTAFLAIINPYMRKSDFDLCDVIFLPFMVKLSYGIFPYLVKRLRHGGQNQT